MGMQNFAIQCLLAVSLAMMAESAPIEAATPPATEAQIEARFRDGISADNIGSYIAELTQHPNFPGSPFAKRNAQWILRQFRAWGWDAHIETFTVPFPRPTVRKVEMLEPSRFTAKLREPPIESDPYSGQQSEQLESYFIYSPDGDVTAPLVYVNFGLREDYAQLDRMGISVKGAIAIARYGKMWRGGKVELAAEHGAVGMLIYSDPHEDGYFQGPTYPQGPWRHPDAVQRGSVLNGKYPGDPLTPMAGSVPGTPRLARQAATSLPQIPSMPLSYADAEPLLRAMSGPTAPESWRGALPLTYRVGPGPALVHLQVAFNWQPVEIYDVIAQIRGSVAPNEWIIRGNHHDGWVYGAQDPHSGHSALLEEARVLGQMHRQGWSPKRTLIYASWDAEEQGTIGSTEWMETHFDELQRKALLYVNSDVTMVGLVDMSGSPSLENFLRGVALDIQDPVSGESSLAHAERNLPVGQTRLSVGPPGYGSDHHAFVARSGIPTVNLDFMGGGFGGSYHSIYDDDTWYTRFNDPGFKYGRATAQLIGTTVLRYADAAVLPFDFGGTADALSRELAGLKALYDADRTAHPPIDFAPLERGVTAIRLSAEHFARVQCDAPTAEPHPRRLAEVNSALLKTERAFLRSGGLPERPYYLNEVYSPGRLWDTVPLPAVGDAILDGHWELAAEQVPLAAKTLGAIAQAIDSAADVVARAD
jgi:N-acetylated-alpha-linked acidic dipeptidase